MSFKNKNRSHLASVREQHTMEMRVRDEMAREKRNGRPKKAPSGDRDIVATIRNIGIGAMGIIGMLVFVSGAPHAYSSSEMEYKPIDLLKIEGAQRVNNVEKLTKMREQFGIKFDRILTPASQETTEAMKRVVSRCRPSNAATVVLPSETAERAFGQATKYLLCVMQKDIVRLCESNERARLVEQLSQYAERRQNFLALAKHYGKSGHALKKFESLDPRVAQAVQRLVAQGLLGAKDFGWMGLFVSEEYAPFLQQSFPRNATCA